MQVKDNINISPSKDQNNDNTTNNNNSYNNNTVSLDNLLIPIQDMDDNYLYLLQKQLQEMKKQRKKTEDETKFLNTRVNCLKNEEEKTIKQIELTKQKTNMKLLQMQRSQTELKHKLQAKEVNRKELESRKRRNMEQRLSIEQGLIMKREYKIKTAIEEARIFKEHQRLTATMIKGMKDEEIIKKKESNERIKSQQLINQTKKRATHLEKKYQIKIDLEEMINKELTAKEETDKKIKRLMMIENEIVRKIQETTQMHKMLIHEFETFMIGGVVNQNNTINENVIDEENQENYTQEEEEEHKKEQEQEYEQEQEQEQEGNDNDQDNENENQYNEYDENSSLNSSDDYQIANKKKRHSYS